MTTQISDGPMKPTGGAFFSTIDPENVIGFCPRCVKGFSLWFGARGNGHQLSTREPLTIVGSIICPSGCRAHYFVTNGEIVMAGDA